MTDLSILMPARNEIYLRRTIDNILENMRGDTEIIIVLDGYTIEIPELPDDPRVKVIVHDKSIGQRQAINEAARLSTAKFIMKLDAHSAVDEGFDVKLMADCEYNWTVIPRMYNLDHENWKPKLIENTKESIRMGKLHDYMYIGFNEKNELRTLYYTGTENKEIHQRKELIDNTMSCMGPCFFMYRDRFWELGGCDENHGGWGQQGIEVSLKAWLSGGFLKVNKKTWFAHWFRGGGGPGFPYHITGKDVDKARNYSMDLWLNNKWPLQVRDFEWVVDKFKPKNWEGRDVQFRGIGSKTEKKIYKENKAAGSAVFETEKKENKDKTKKKSKIGMHSITPMTNNKTIADFEVYFYRHLLKNKLFPKWDGVQVTKYPNDLFTYQELIFENKPDILIECGTSHGGSALFFASLFDIIGSGQVISIDKYPKAKLPQHKRITYLTGGSTSTEILAKVNELVKWKTVMVSLDSNHERKHVKRELVHYGKIVTKGQYMVVEDCNLGEAGPKGAVDWYLARTNKFKQTHLEDRFLISLNGGGWLRRV